MAVAFGFRFVMAPRGPSSIAGSSPTERQAAALSRHLAELTSRAAGVHRDCALEHALEELPIDLEEAGRAYDRAYASLMDAITPESGSLPGELEVVDGHSCVFQGRRFGHVILSYRDRVVSVLVAAVDRAPGQPARGETSAAGPGPRVSACSSAVDFHVSCFETPRHAVFVVSDLAEADNAAGARALAPSLVRHIARAEAA